VNLSRVAALASVGLLAFVPPALGQSIIVSPTGPVRSLAVAVRSAPRGARVVVRAGTYREPPIVIDRPLTIEGEGRPLIEAVAEATLIRVIADDVTVRGLVLASITPSHIDDRAALRFERVRRCRAEDLEIRDAPYGVMLIESSDCHIAGNVVSGSGRQPMGNAIHLWNSRRMTVRDNNVRGHRDGLYFEFVQETTIERNTSEHNARYGLHFMFSDRCVYRDNRFEHNGAGVAVMYSRHVEMTRNAFLASQGAASYGLLLKDISESELGGNEFGENTVGLLIEGGGRLSVLRNRFFLNGWAVRLMANSPLNRFEGNTFEGNSFDMSTNSRSTEAVVAGNWWDRYAGYDLNRDGRGDVAFHPVRLFAVVVAANPPSVILLRSPFVDLLDAAERVLPVLTPETLADSAPLMERPR
jgi:nitrous oxidase accessory protein